MREYDWNPYPHDWHKSNDYRNSRWNYDPRDENYYLGRIDNSGDSDPDQRYYSDGSDRYYRNEEVRQRIELPPGEHELKDEHAFKNNAFYGERKRNYSWGPHRGKGPKDYARPVERIREDASDRLMEDSLVDASEIEIWIKDNELILSGTVETRFKKRRAEYLVENVSGINHVQNNLRVAGNRATEPHVFE